MSGSSSVSLISTRRTPALERAYATCRAIARREAKNFYYAFLVLPARKRDAMCAIYAFMRKADDLADDESLSIAERRASMSAWAALWHEAQGGSATLDPVFLAVRDTQSRFGISDDLLDQLVEGTTLDLAEGSGARQYETFEDLYAYCYLVASVVGLVCIRIFGYSDERAEALAEKTGIAFQLTNILRDVREDAERGRIYLPQQDMEQFSVDPAELAPLKEGRHIRLNQRELLEFEAQRAREYYRAAAELLPLIDADSRPSLWVLVTIYRTLLEHIEAKGYDVFTKRVSVGAWTKLSILLRGILATIRNRVFGG